MGHMDEARKEEEEVMSADQSLRDVVPVERLVSRRSAHCRRRFSAPRPATKAAIDQLFEMDELDNIARVNSKQTLSSDQSSDEDDNVKELDVVRKWKANDTILAEYDHLGRTPPRTRIRNKEKNKIIHVDENTVNNPNKTPPPRFQRVIRRNTDDNIVLRDTNLSQESYDQKRAKRRSLKTLRGHERDLKLDIDKCSVINSDGRPLQLYMTPKLVESCNRFKSLHSQPICHTRDSQKINETFSDGVVDQRANFHNAFSMLIKLGNGDKNCRRTMSVEEYTWQNELKDLLWLEVCAHRAGRTATQQDAYLLTHRESVQNLLHKILDYKFEYSGKKCTHSGIYTTQLSSVSSNDADQGIDEQSTNVETNPVPERFAECLCIDCKVCSKVISEAMHQVENLLNSLSEAESLYPSSKAMAVQHPIITSEEFIDKTKAMCLWYNMIHHQRLKILIIKKLLYKHRWKTVSKTKEDIAVRENEPHVTNGNPSTGHRVKFKINDETLTGNFDDDTDDDNDVKTSTQVHRRATQQTVDSGIDLNKNSNSSDGDHDNNVDLKSIINNSAFPNVENTRSPYESAESSSGNSINSNESGFTSLTNEYSDDNGNQSPLDEFNVYNMGSLGDLTKLRLFNPKLNSPYRDYIEKMLKIRGLKRALYFLEKLHLSVLKKARMTLEKYEADILNEDVELRNDQNGDSSDDDFEYERHTRCEVDIRELKKECIDLRRYGAWSKETLDMCLPSYRSAFLFLSTVPIENIHEFLTMRLESKPEKPSALSIKQLIHELREGIAIAVRLRARFIRHVHTALTTESDDPKYQKFYNQILTTFDNTLNEVYKLYLSYLSDWAGMEHLPRATLSAEWTFNCYLAQRLRPAATVAPLTFCCLTVRQLESTADRIKSRVEELREKAGSFMKDDPNNSIKLQILAICRNLQCLLSEEREKALSTAQFARTVSKHLYHNAVFREYRQKIYKSMFAVQKKLCWTIDQMQETTSPQRLLELEENDRPSVQSRTREIVSQGYKFGFEFHKELCRLINDDNLPDNGYNSYARNSLSMCRQSKLVRTESINYDNIQATIEENYFSMNPYTPSSNNEFLYPSECPKVTNLQRTKDEVALSFSLYGRKDLTRQKTNRRSPRFMDPNDLADLKPEDFQNGIPGCDSCNRVNIQDDCDSNNCARKLNSDKTMLSNCEITVSRGMVKFAKQWMNFAMTRCERGRGLRPRWANHGMEFLMLTCDPQHTKHLTDEEFEELKSMMDGCISHVIGSSRGNNNNIVSPTTVGTPPVGTSRPRTSPLNQYNMSNRVLQPTSPLTTPIEPELLTQSFYNKETVQPNKHLIPLNKLDNERDGILRRAGAIGCVRHGSKSKHHFRPRPVTFKWQRGIKIGQGRFGKVYTVVNTESGQLLAMKEVSLGVGDIRAVDLAANELKVLESVVHPNLVRYYGVEIHREEILIFMELCVEGSLESMIAGCSSNTDGTNGNGLPEQSIRRYTGQLVSAISALHERSIAHRDIKSGNIFLTEGGNCLKLGDFGCAVKIRANTTVPGELQGYVGTQAYMAPEVFMKSSGHGRAADIWSLGCVVVEMASGKHPWSEYDSNYQIMFVVGMGNRPEIPPSLSVEGSDFCMECLQHDPADRSSAEKLANHHFLKVNRY